MKDLAIISVIVISSVFLGACGSSDSNNESLSSDVLSDGAVAETVSVNLAEAFDMLSDSTSYTETSSLSLTQSSSENSQLEYSFSKNCREEDSSAVVSLSKLLSGSISFEGPRVSISRSVSGESQIERIWSNENTSISCNDEDKSAEIDWDSSGIEGLVLDITFSRTRNDEVSKTLKSRDLDVEKTIQRSAEGTRNVSWLSHTENIEDNTFTRVHEISSQITRISQVSSSILDEDINLNMTIKTLDEAPLNVSTIRDSSSYQLVSKTINSGQLETVLDSGQKIIASFSDLLILFSADSCTGESGSLTLSYYDLGSELADRVVEITVDSGDLTVYDITDSENVVAIEDYDYELCQLANFK